MYKPISASAESSAVETAAEITYGKELDVIFNY